MPVASCVAHLRVVRSARPLWILGSDDELQEMTVTVERHLENGRIRSAVHDAKPVVAEAPHAVGSCDQPDNLAVRLVNLVPQRQPCDHGPDHSPNGVQARRRLDRPPVIRARGERVGTQSEAAAVHDKHRITVGVIEHRDGGVRHFDGECATDGEALEDRRRIRDCDFHPISVEWRSALDSSRHLGRRRGGACDSDHQQRGELEGVHQDTLHIECFDSSRDTHRTEDLTTTLCRSNVLRDRKSAQISGSIVPHPNSKRAKAAKQKRAAHRRERTATNESTTAAGPRRTAERDVALGRARRSAWVRNLGRRVAIVGIVGLIAAGLWFGLRPDPELSGVVRVADDGGGHVADATYASASPTSGAHEGTAPSCGLYSSQLEAPLAVHALEHGAVVIWYDAERPELGTELSELVDGYPSHVIVSPNNRLETPVIATAWNRLKSFSGAEPGVRDFIDTYRFRGPESEPCERSA